MNRLDSCTTLLFVLRSPEPRELTDDRRREVLGDSGWPDAAGRADERLVN